MSGNSSVRVNALQLKNYPDSTDTLVAWSNASNLAVLLPVSKLYAGGNNDLVVNTVIITSNSTPVSSLDNCTQGQLWYDDNYLYIATETNLIKRIALSTF